MMEITSRSHIYQIVSSFYSKIKNNPSIGHIFTKAISENEWESHMQKITDFWDSAIFGSMTYVGNPPMKHVNLDKDNDHEIDKSHFDTWLSTWNQNIDEQFSGKVAQDMKLRAQKMANGLLLSILNNKPSA